MVKLSARNFVTCFVCVCVVRFLAARLLRAEDFWMCCVHYIVNILSMGRSATILPVACLHSHRRPLVNRLSMLVRHGNTKRVFSNADSGTGTPLRLTTSCQTGRSLRVASHHNAPSLCLLSALSEPPATLAAFDFIDFPAWLGCAHGCCPHERF